MLTAKQVSEAEARYANSLTQYGPSNMATIRAEVTLREYREAFEAQRELREVKRQMKELGVKRSSCFNGGHSPESYRLNSECFRLETIIKRVVA